MGDPARLTRGDWEAVLHAPFHVYSAVASIDGEPLEAQFRRLGDEIAAGGATFPEGTIGRTMLEALAENLELLWAGYQASNRSVKDGLRRARKALRRAPDDESEAIRDWLLVLALAIAKARRTVGAGSVTRDEVGAIRDMADWLERPVSESGQA